jgi:hypothetical protein
MPVIIEKNCVFKFIWLQTNVFDADPLLLKKN